MPVKLDVLNAALMRVGARGGNMADQRSPTMQVADAAYARCRDLCLGLYPWPFALRSALLNRSAARPLFGFRYAYALPGDCLRVVEARRHDAEGRVSSAARDEAGPLYRLEGRELHTDAEALALRYVSNEDGEMGDAFADALAWRLAFEISPFLQQGGNAGDFFQLFEQALDRAKVEADAQDHPGPTRWPSRFLAERMVI